MTWKDALVWLKEWKIPGLAIDIHNNVICQFEPQQINAHINHARFNIIMHNEHVWLVNENVKEFAQKFNNRDTIPFSSFPNYWSNDLSNKWLKKPKKANIIYCVDNVKEVMKIYDSLGDEACNVAVITGESPEVFIRDLALDYGIEVSHIFL